MQCDPDDETKYAPKQCLPDSDRCWCVDIYGGIIPDSHNNPGETPIDCGEFYSHQKVRSVQEVPWNFGEIRVEYEHGYYPDNCRFFEAVYLPKRDEGFGSILWGMYRIKSS